MQITIAIIYYTTYDYLWFLNLNECPVPSREGVWNPLVQRTSRPFEVGILIARM